VRAHKEISSELPLAAAFALPHNVSSARQECRWQFLLVATCRPSGGCATSNGGAVVKPRMGFPYVYTWPDMEGRGLAKAPYVNRNITHSAMCSTLMSRNPIAKANRRR